MEKKYEHKLSEIYHACMANPEMGTAKAYGLTETDDGLVAKLIGNNEDVYLLIRDLDNDKIHMNYDFMAVVTTGWAAPLDQNGEIKGAPSAHPERRRVTLVASLDINERKTFGSILHFDGDDDLVFDDGSATGMLAEALENLVS